VIVYTPREWDAFVRGVKDGDFDFERPRSALRRSAARLREF